MNTVNKMFFAVREFCKQYGAAVYDMTGGTFSVETALGCTYGDLYRAWDSKKQKVREKYLMDLIKNAD